MLWVLSIFSDHSARDLTPQFPLQLYGYRTSRKTNKRLREEDAERPASNIGTAIRIFNVRTTQEAAKTIRTNDKSEPDTHHQTKVPHKPTIV